MKNPPLALQVDVAYRIPDQVSGNKTEQESLLSSAFYTPLSLVSSEHVLAFAMRCSVLGSWSGVVFMKSPQEYEESVIPSDYDG